MPGRAKSARAVSSLTTRLEGASINPSHVQSRVPICLLLFLLGNGISLSTVHATPPHGREIGALTAERCLEVLRRHHVDYERRTVEGIDVAVVVRGSIGGITVRPHNGRNRLHALMDCRLVVALLAWAPVLRRAGVERIEHYSAYRPGARVASTRSPSGHSRGLAVDAALFHLEDGTVLDVLTAWTERTRGEEPCAPHPSEPESSRRLRSMVCAAVQADLFQVVITPHHDDDHQNHVHLEVVPDVDWSFVH